MTLSDEHIKGVVEEHLPGATITFDPEQGPWYANWNGTQQLADYRSAYVTHGRTTYRLRIDENTDLAHCDAHGLVAYILRNHERINGTSYGMFSSAGIVAYPYETSMWATKPEQSPAKP